MKLLLAISLLLATSLHSVCGCCFVGGYAESEEVPLATCCGSASEIPAQPPSCGGDCGHSACGEDLAALDPLSYQNLFVTSAAAPLFSASVIEMLPLVDLNFAKFNFSAHAPALETALRQRICVYRL